jgi:hypothetical protein
MITVQINQRMYVQDDKGCTFQETEHYSVKPTSNRNHHQYVFMSALTAATSTVTIPVSAGTGVGT